MSRHVLFGALGAAVLAAAVAGGGYLYVRHQAEARAVAGLEALRDSLAGSATVTWGPVQAAVFGSAVQVETLTIRADGVPGLVVGRAELTEGARAGTVSGVLTDISAMMPGPEGPIALTIARSTGTDLAMAPPQAVLADLSRSFSTALRSLNASSIVMDGIQLTDRARGETTAIRTLSLGQVAGGIAGTMSAENMTMEISAPPAGQAQRPQGTMSADRLHARALTLGGWDEPMDSPAMQRRAQDLFGLEALTMHGLRVAMNDMPAISIGGLGVENIGRDQGMVTSLRLFAEAVEMPLDMVSETADEAAQFRETLLARGIDRMRFTAEYVQSWDPAARVVAFGPVTLDIDRLGRLNMALRLGGIDLPALMRAQMDAGPDAMPELPPSAIMSMELHEASLTYADGELADLIIDQAAAGDRAGMAASLTALASMAMGPQTEPRAKALALEAIAGFIQGANGFEVALRPRRPVSLPALEQAQAAGRVGDLLNLEIRGY